jgi:hypothetical protein
MQIDKSNYEIWLIDWLDGNLSDSQVDQLKIFLAENPELKEEFDELDTFTLKSPATSFQHKAVLKKSASDLPVSQFEYFCVAYLENDLSPFQQAELKEIIDQDPAKKREFELFQKTRLAPGNISFKNKNHLIRRTVVQNVIRLSVIGLSAAAAVALIIITQTLTPGNLPVKNINTAQNNVIDSSLLQPLTNNIQGKTITEINPVPSKLKKKAPFVATQNNIPVLSQSYTTILQKTDSIPGNSEMKASELKKVPVYNEIDFQGISVNNTLIPNNSKFIVLPIDDGRSKLSRFIAKNFREKILRENTVKDSPLKAYEIAEAGVNGLNKLLGWEMALDERNDENGELKSVYFSSKILKFNAPVKKSDPLP